MDTKAYIEFKSNKNIEKIKLQSKMKVTKCGLPLPTLETNLTYVLGRLRSNIKSRNERPSNYELLESSANRLPIYFLTPNFKSEVRIDTRIYIKTLRWLREQV